MNIYAWYNLSCFERLRVQEKDIWVLFRAKRRQLHCVSLFYDRSLSQGHLCHWWTFMFGIICYDLKAFVCTKGNGYGTLSLFIHFRHILSMPKNGTLGSEIEFVTLNEPSGVSLSPDDWSPKYWLTVTNNEPCFHQGRNLSVAKRLKRLAVFTCTASSGIQITLWKISVLVPLFFC